MYRNSFIKKFIAGFLLLLFAVSVTPKQFFHDVITGHKHTYSNTADVLKIQTARNNFQCNWHNDAVESPFTDEPGTRFDPPCPVYTSYVNFYGCNYSATEQFFSSLRGPPVQA